MMNSARKYGQSRFYKQTSKKMIQQLNKMHKQQQQGRAARPRADYRTAAAPLVRARSAANGDNGAGYPPKERAVIILPGLGNNAADYGDLAERLRARGLAVAVAPVSRPDWARNAAALTDPAWWQGRLKPRPAVDWYLERVSAAMDALKREAGGAPVTMLTHSAGGWLGRVWLKDFGTTGVDRFVSLGSPHAPPPPGVADQTRGILSYCADACPGAFHREIRYVTIAGRYVRGAPLSAKGAPLKAKFAGAGYAQVCGAAEVDGDFIVPTTAAHLDGAVQIDLDGAFHSPLGSKLPWLGPWYGDDPYFGAWADWVDGDLAAAAEATVSMASADDDGSGSGGEDGGGSSGSGSEDGVAALPRVFVVGGLPAMAAKRA